MTKYESFVGKVLDGRYKILELVGIGGMASVLKAQDLVMKRIVAIKILNDEYTGDENAEKRFIDESKAVAMLSNKNIVNVYDVAIYPDIKYIVMEYLDGITLREYLDNKKVIGWKEACVYVLQILRALEHAHSKGIIHRDIKPQNVMLMKNGDIKVTDFGIAKLPNSVSEQTDEKAVGTVYYISPEQACGKETDYYSDIYSLGVMFYEAVTGTLPFIAETPMEVAMMQVNNEPVHPRDIVLDIPVGVSQIILKAMEKSPDDRFHSAHTMIKAIEWVLRYPDVIFNMNSNSAEEGTVGNTSLVSIDMIATSELEPYNEDEISEALKKKKKKKDDEEKVKKKKKKKALKTRKRKANRTMFPIIFGISLALILVWVIIFATVGIKVWDSFMNMEEEVEAEFPDIVGKYYGEELKNNLLSGTYGAKFVIDEDTVFTETREGYKHNEIIATEPAAGHVSKVGDDGKIHFTSVTVNVTEKRIIPNIIGLTKNEAGIMVKNEGLEVEFVETENSDNPYYNSNQVIQTYPAVGKEVEAGSTVTIYIYKRTQTGNTAKMPNVIGLKESDAKKLAQTYSLYTVKFVYTEVIGGNNRVIAQSIKEGTISPKGTTVTLTVAIPKPIPIMPSLIGATLEDAKTLLEKAWKNNEVQFSTLYFTVNIANKEALEAECAEAESLTEAISILMKYNCQQVFENDGVSVVIYQGIKAGDEIPFETKFIEIVNVTYTIDPIVDGDTDPEGGDTSGEDTSSGDGDNSSEDDTSTEEESSEEESSEEPIENGDESSEVTV